MMIAPHGGTLVNRVLDDDEARDATDRAGTLQTLHVSRELANDVRNIARGVFSPLTGFIGNDDLQSIIKTDRLADGTPWTIPILLDVPEQDTVSAGEAVVLQGPNGDGPLALLDVEDVYEWDRTAAAQSFFGTTDTNHPGVAGLQEREDWLVAGDISLIDNDRGPFAEVNCFPAQTRADFEELGWETVIAFQTRNVPHIGHEFLQKTVLGFTDGLFIQPIIGKKKPGDYLDEVIISAYEALLANYYSPDRVYLNILPTEMRYGGPKEAILHAIMRQNYGCTGIIIGRDHAGVDDADGNPYYGEEDAIEIFDEFPELDIEPFSIAGDFGYCPKCGSVSSDRMCPHEDEFISFSGTEIRALINEGAPVPEQVMRPEVLDCIMQFDRVFV